MIDVFWADDFTHDHFADRYTLTKGSTYPSQEGIPEFERYLILPQGAGPNGQGGLYARELDAEDPALFLGLDFNDQSQGPILPAATSVFLRVITVGVFEADTVTNTQGQGQPLFGVGLVSPPAARADGGGFLAGTSGGSNHRSVMVYFGTNNLVAIATGFPGALGLDTDSVFSTNYRVGAERQIFLPSDVDHTYDLRVNIENGQMTGTMFVDNELAVAMAPWTLPADPFADGTFYPGATLAWRSARSWASSFMYDIEYADASSSGSAVAGAVGGGPVRGSKMRGDAPARVAGRAIAGTYLDDSAPPPPVNT